jgi:hypothetical protein
VADHRFKQAIDRIDAANAQDPNRLAINGVERPLELTHAEMRTAWITKLKGEEASEALLLAARGQHLRRWEIPRESYPRDRAGYLAWRNALKEFHAEQTAGIMAEFGYEAETIARVKQLILKQRLKLDEEVQALEDALCLVFLETQFADFAKKEPDKIIDIVRRTWRKMSAAGQNFALQLPLKPETLKIIKEALS